MPILEPGTHVFEFGIQNKTNWVKAAIDRSTWAVAPVPQTISIKVSLGSQQLGSEWVWYRTFTTNDGEYTPSEGSANETYLGFYLPEWFDSHKQKKIRAEITIPDRAIDIVPSNVEQEKTNRPV